eukprot:1188389-Pyramimonas_sp.AAC.1
MPRQGSATPRGLPQSMSSSAPSHASSSRRTPTGRSSQLSPSRAPFSYRWTLLMLAHCPRRCASATVRYLLAMSIDGPECRV